MSPDVLLAVVCVVIALLGAVLGRKREVAATGALWTVALLLAIALAVRSVRAGHLPVLGTFEMNVSQALGLLLAAALLRRTAGEGYLSVPLVAAALLLLHTLTLNTAITPQTISERSLWVDLHAILAWISLPCYVHACCLAFREGRSQDLALRWLGYGFLTHTALAFAGVYYASVLFARPWEWDPVQTLGLLSWLLVGATVHFRLFFNVSPHRQRWFLVAVLLTYVVSAKVLIYLPPGQTFHVFELGFMAELR